MVYISGQIGKFIIKDNFQIDSIKHTGMLEFKKTCTIFTTLQNICGGVSKT